eukprot:COSAG02_NODE_1832_length_10723_cov_13.708020_5_plen_456_part_00
MAATNNPVSRLGDYPAGLDDGVEPVPPPPQHSRPCVLPREIAWLGTSLRTGGSAPLWLFILVLLGAALGFCLAAPVTMTRVAGRQHASPAIWLFSILIAVGNVLILPALFSLRTALSPDAGLAALGLGEKRVAPSTAAALARWRWVHYMPALQMPGTGILMGLALRDSSMGWGEQLHFWLLVPLACAVCGVHVYFAWWMTMKTGAALAAVDIERVTASAHACTPSDREAWVRDVARPTANLHAGLLQSVSQTFGTGLGATTFSLWAYALAAFCSTLDAPFVAALDAAAGFPMGVAIAFFGVSCAFLPLLLAMDLARVSTLCDELLEVLNANRLDNTHDLAVRSELSLLIDSLNHLNGRQGLGFTSFGVVVDMRTLYRVGTGLVGMMSTVIPLILGMMDPEVATAVDCGGGGGGGHSTAGVVLTSMEAMVLDTLRVPSDVQCNVSYGIVQCHAGGE